MDVKTLNNFGLKYLTSSPKPKTPPLKLGDSLERTRLIARMVVTQLGRRPNEELVLVGRRHAGLQIYLAGTYPLNDLLPYSEATAEVIENNLSYQKLKVILQTELTAIIIFVSDAYTDLLASSALNRQLLMLLKNLELSHLLDQAILVGDQFWGLVSQNQPLGKTIDLQMCFAPLVRETNKFSHLTLKLKKNDLNNLNLNSNLWRRQLADSAWPVEIEEHEIKEAARLADRVCRRYLDSVPSDWDDITLSYGHDLENMLSIFEHHRLRDLLIAFCISLGDVTFVQLLNSRISDFLRSPHPPIEKIQVFIDLIRYLHSKSNYQQVAPALAFGYLAYAYGNFMQAADALGQVEQVDPHNQLLKLLKLAMEMHIRV